MKLIKQAVPARYSASLLTKSTAEIVLSWPCSDEEIINAHDRLLTDGVHYIRVSSLDAGRQLIEPLVNSIHYFRESAVMTTAALPASMTVVDLQNAFIRGGYLLRGNTEMIEDFILDFCQTDFLWIEQTRQLISLPWYAEFKQKVTELHLHEHMPIVFISYN